jgi:hypothetical protein
MTNLGKIFIVESKESPPNDDESGVGSLNYNPHH